jgi:hypothetical protein
MGTALKFLCALSFAPTLASSGPPYHFATFETVLLPQWLALFAVPPSSAGRFSYFRNGSAPTVYGSADVAHVLATVNQLNLSGPAADSWASELNAFQDAATGFFRVAPLESAGFQPWHAAAYAPAALALIGRASAHAPRWALDIVQGGESVWNATFFPLLNESLPPPGPTNVWNAGHKIAAVPAALLLANLSAPEFFEWWAGPSFLEGTVDAATGYWCERKEWAPPSVVCLGGAFHMDFVLSALQTPLFIPGVLGNTSLGLQQESGLWGSFPPSYIDLDGLYCSLRPAAQLGKPQPLWQRAQSACDAFLAAAEAALNDATVVLGDTAGSYGANSHLLPAAVSGVAECAKWFPDLVDTVRPWIQTLDRAPFV